MSPSLSLPPLRRSARTPSRLGRTIGVAAVTLAVAAIPATASAAVRTGSVQDPQGDASAFSGPVLDLKSVAVRYDDSAGTVVVTWTYYDDVWAKRDQSGRIMGGGFRASAPFRFPGPSDAMSVMWTGQMAGVEPQWNLTTSLGIMGAAEGLPGKVTVSDDGHVVTAEFSHAKLVGHDWQYSDAGPTINGDGPDRFVWDGFTDPNSPISPPPVPTPPANEDGDNGDQGMTINNEAQYTNDPDVTLSVIAPSWAKTLRVANDGGFLAAKTFPARKTIRWRLAESGPERLPKTVYLRFGNDPHPFADDIILDQTEPTVSSATSAAVAARTYEVRLRAKDQISGVAKLQFANSRRRPSALRKFKRNSRYKGASAPKYVRVRDRAGNFSRWRSIR